MRNKLMAVLLLAGFTIILAACTAGATTQAPTSAPPEPTAIPAPTESPATMLGGRLLFSRFIEATHTFTGMFVSRPDGSGETAVPLPWTEGGGRWSRSGTQIAVATLLADERVGTAIIAPDGTVLRVLEIPDATLNLVCTVWSRDDARLACEAWDDAEPSRGGIYTVRASDGGDLQRLTTPPDGMRDLPGDYSPAGQFVFKRHAGDEGEGPLMLVDANGGEPRPLSNRPMEDAGRFAPDGRSVVTSTQGRLEVINLDGTVLHQITVDGSYLFGPAWSPDGTRIAFSLATTGPFADVYTSLPDGTDRRRVTETAANEITIDWGVDSGQANSPPAPLEGQILFTRAGGAFGDETIFVANADGTDERQLTELGVACCPRLSPNGRDVMVMTESQPEGGPLTGATIPLDGSDLTRLPLTDPTLNLVPQAWSPDATSIAFEGWDDSDPSRTGVYTALAADGTDLIRLTSVDGVHDIPADYSPDGTRLVFYRAAVAEPAPWDIGGALWVVNADGTGARKLDTPGTVPSWWARWSPNGSKILFATARNQQDAALWTVDADGSNLTKLFEDAEGRYPITPAWSPDGTKIIFALNPIADEFQHPANGIYVINADGSELALVIGGSDFKRRIEWMP